MNKNIYLRSTSVNGNPGYNPSVHTAKVGAEKRLQLIVPQQFTDNRQFILIASDNCKPHGKNSHKTWSQTYKAAEWPPPTGNQALIRVRINALVVHNLGEEYLGYTTTTLDHTHTSAQVTNERNGTQNNQTHTPSS